VFVITGARYNWDSLSAVNSNNIEAENLYNKTLKLSLTFFMIAKHINKITKFTSYLYFGAKNVLF
jgi:hypothetical protein